MKLIIVRHGVTLENDAGIAQGQTDGTLSGQGHLDNEKLGLRLRQEELQCIYSSPLARALQTAEAVHRYHPGIPLVKDDRLMERHLGVLQGVPYPVPYKEADVYEGMETAGAMAARVKSFLDECSQKHDRDSIAVVSHGYLIKVMLSVVGGLPIEEFHRVKLMGNSSFIVHEI